ncbi:hypothetical protein BGP79_15650 [Tersicoccus sp. Bi-70]|nr:hypothetical protein BGP79_15650 [Tersicoccus sp. Bi-70]
MPGLILIVVFALIGATAGLLCSVRSINSPSSSGALRWGGGTLLIAALTVTACLVTPALLRS